MVALCNSNKIVGIFMAVFSTLFISGCSENTPNCSDSDVQDLVTKIYNSKLQDALLSNAILIQLGMNPRLQGNPTYEQWNQLKTQNSDIKKIVDYVDKQVADANMELTGIRTNSKNEEAKKSLCGGDFLFSNGKKVSVDYSVQYTEDGQIYAEVSEN